MHNDVMERIRDMARGILEFEGMEFVHLEMKNQGGTAFLRLYIDREGGVTLDDCSRVSRRLSAQLDAEDPIDGHYTLEVSSPGLDRPLFGDRDFERFRGHLIQVRITSPLAGRRRFAGRLDGVVDGMVRLVLDGEEAIDLPTDQIAEARIVPNLGVRGSRGGRKGQHG